MSTSDDAVLTFSEAMTLWKKNLELTQDENLVIDRMATYTYDEGYAVLARLIANNGEIGDDGIIRNINA